MSDLALIVTFIGVGIAVLGFLLCWPAQMYYRTRDGFPLIPSRRSPATLYEMNEENKKLTPGNEGVGMAFRWGVRLVVTGAVIFVVGQVLDHFLPRPIPPEPPPPVLPAQP